MSLLALMLSIACLAPAAQGDATFSAPGLGPLEGEGVGPDRFAVGGLEIACGEVTYGGTTGDNSRSLALEPAFGECIARTLTGLPADFYQELCDFVLHGAKRIGGEKQWKASVDIKCRSVWHAVGWDLYETQQKYTAGQFLCAIRIPEQAGVGTAVLRNTAGRRRGIEIRWNLDDLEYEVLLPSLPCGSIEGVALRDASYRGKAVIRGTEMVSRER
jgi:hypothetical protein